MTKVMIQLESRHARRMWLLEEAHRREMTAPTAVAATVITMVAVRITSGPGNTSSMDEPRSASRRREAGLSTTMA